MRFASKGMLLAPRVIIKLSPRYLGGGALAPRAAQCLSLSQGTHAPEPLRYTCAGRSRLSALNPPHPSSPPLPYLPQHLLSASAQPLPKPTTNVGPREHPPSQARDSSNSKKITKSNWFSSIVGFPGELSGQEKSVTRSYCLY